MLASIGFWTFIGYWVLRAFLYFVHPYIIVDQGTVVILQRWQKFYKLLEPGFHPIVPWLDVPLTVHWQYREQSRNGKVVTKTYKSDCINTKECTIYLPYTEYYTNDDVIIGTAMAVNYTIRDAKKAVYETSDLYQTLQNDLAEQLQDVMTRMKCGEVDGVAIGKAMKSANGKDVWERYGVKIGKCRATDLRMPPSIDEANTNTIEQARQHHSDIAMADVAYASEMKQLDLTSKLQDKEHEIRMNELNRELKLQDKRDELRSQRHTSKMKRYQAFANVVKGSGLPPEFFINWLDKKALKQLVKRGDQGGNLSTIYVPTSMGGVPDNHQTSTTRKRTLPGDPPSTLTTTDNSV
jgi:regulator of protease activity HflC (stomatin/prohibitin superfamily)